MRLDSGDVFIFGGRSRMIVHSVLRVIPHTMPGYMRKHMREGRLNITFRYVPAIASIVAAADNKGLSLRSLRFPSSTQGSGRLPGPHAVPALPSHL